MNPPITRSNLLIIAFQLDGFCTALRHATSCGLPISSATFETLQRLRDVFAAVHVGPSLEVLPVINGGSSASDLLLFAEILRTTVGAFLSPDEILEKHRAVGFHE